MDITRESADRLTVTVDGDRLTGIRTGIPSRGFAAQRVSAAVQGGATLVVGDRFEHWPIRRVVENGGEFYLCGPELSGRTVAEHLAEAPVTDAPWLTTLLQAVATASVHEDLALGNVTTSLVTDTGAVLFLNRDLAVQINSNLPLPERRVSHFPYRPERPTDADTELYQALAIAYHALAGVPLCTKTEVQASARCHAAALEKPPLHTHRPELTPELCERIEAALQYRDRRTVRAVNEIAAAIERGPVAQDIDDGERDRRTAAAAERLTRNRASTQRRTFWRNHGRTILFAALAAAVVLAIPATILRNALRPPATAGMGPRAVAETFYSAWNSLDHMLMEETLARGVARNTVREVTNVYVIDRVQMARQWESALMPADAWLDEGRPEGRIPYGVANLDLRLMSQGADRATVRAEYDMWRPENGGENPDGTTRTQAVHTHTVDELTLEPTRTAWEITAITRTTGATGTVPVTAGEPSSEPAPAASTP